MIPVYVINGFLDSGKTEFIIYTLGQSYFQTRGTTLLLVCEEGENEYEKKPHGNGSDRRGRGFYLPEPHQS